MGAARDLQPLPTVFTNSDWEQDFEFFGPDTTQPLDYDGWSAALTLAPARQAQPASGDVHTLTTTAGTIVRPAPHRFGVRVEAAAMTSWKPGLHVVQLTATSPDASDTVTLYIGSVQVFRGLAQTPSLGGGDQATPQPRTALRQILTDDTRVRVIMGPGGPQGRSAKDAVIQAGELPAGASDTAFTDWLRDQATPPDAIKTANFQAAVRRTYLLDSRLGAFSATAPSGLQPGDEWRLIDLTGSCGSNPVTVLRNGYTIEGQAQDYAINVARIGVRFRFDGSTITPQLD